MASGSAQHDVRLTAGATHPEQARTQAPAATQNANATPARPPELVVTRLDRARRASLVRIISLWAVALALLLMPAAFYPAMDIPALLAILLAVVCQGMAYWLNLSGHVNAAATMLLGGIALAAAWVVVGGTFLGYPLELVDLRLYSFLLLPTLLACVLLPPRGVIVLASAIGAFTVVSLLLVPKSPDLQSYWAGTNPLDVGSAYDVLLVPLCVEVAAAIVAWLGARNIQHALYAAARADELQEANTQIQRQAQELEAQRHRMQQAVAQIRGVHAALAHGHWEARARVDDPEMLPVATSLNLLLDRIARLTRQESEYARMEHAVRELAEALHGMWAGKPFVLPDYGGTPLDQVLLELARLRSPARAHTAFPTSESDPEIAAQSGHWRTATPPPSSHKYNRPANRPTAGSPRA
jgi:hypothetical protein